MSFKDKLKEKRLEANLTQVQLAEKVSVTPRTIQHYELGTRKPTKLDIVEKLAKALNTTPEYLLGQNGLLVVAAHEQGGSKAARDIDELVSEVTGMFAGGRLSDEALDGAMKALNDAYKEPFCALQYTANAAAPIRRCAVLRFRLVISSRAYNNRPAVRTKDRFARYRCTVSFCNPPIRLIFLQIQSFRLTTKAEGRELPYEASPLLRRSFTPIFM